MCFWVMKGGKLYHEKTDVLTRVICLYLTFAELVPVLTAGHFVVAVENSAGAFLELNFFFFEQ